MRPGAIRPPAAGRSGRSRTARRIRRRASPPGQASAGWSEDAPGPASGRTALAVQSRRDASDVAGLLRHHRPARRERKAAHRV